MFSKTDEEEMWRKNPVFYFANKHIYRSGEVNMLPPPCCSRAGG